MIRGRPIKLRNRWCSQVHTIWWCLIRCSNGSKCKNKWWRIASSKTNRWCTNKPSLLWVSCRTWYRKQSHRPNFNTSSCKAWLVHKLPSKQLNYLTLCCHNCLRLINKSLLQRSITTNPLNSSSHSLNECLIHCRVCTRKQLVGKVTLKMSMMISRSDNSNKISKNWKNNKFRNKKIPNNLKLHYKGSKLNLCSLYLYSISKRRSQPTYSRCLGQCHQFRPSTNSSPIMIFNL